MSVGIVEDVEHEQLDVRSYTDADYMENEIFNDNMSSDVQDTENKQLDMHSYTDEKTQISAEDHESIMNVDNPMSDEYHEVAYDDSSENNSDDEIIHTEDKVLPEKLKGMLNTVMFERSNICVEDVFNMAQSIYLRYNVSQSTRLAMLNMAKIFAGPEFKNLNKNNYYTSKFYKPSGEKKMYTFYCSECKVPVLEHIPKSQLQNKTHVQCLECLKQVSLSTSSSNYFINIDVEYQLRTILQDNEILQTVLQNARQARASRNQEVNCISDMKNGEIYKK